jgi:transcription initiation factor TFIIIB Brf1 subunit/transcription initiation factor TFIIB
MYYKQPQPIASVLGIDGVTLQVIACRLANNPRTLAEAAKAAGIEQKEIGRNIKYVMLVLLELVVVESDPLDTHVTG